MTELNRFAYRRPLMGWRFLNPARWRKLRRLARDHRVLAGSALFDAKWYLANNPDVARGSEEPALHYLLHGAQEGRAPSPHFDTSWYLQRNPDVKDAGVNPLVHYILSGKDEGRSPLPATRTNQWSLDPAQASARNLTQFAGHISLSAGERIWPDVGRLQNYDLIHLRSILTETRIFDERFYVFVNPDVKSSGVDPFQHFMEDGWREGRDPGPYFSVSYYCLTNPGLPTGWNPVIHYIMNGGTASGKQTHPNYFGRIPISFSPRTAFYSMKLPVRRTKSSELTPSTPTIAVHAHCYYEDVVPQLAHALRAIPHIDTLLVTFPYYRQDLERTIRHNFKLPNVKRLEVDAVPNRGRDVGPLLVRLDKRLRNFDLVLHIHTKKSVDGAGFGAEWLNDILHKMLFNQTYVENILRMFERNSLLGIVAPMPYWRVRPFMVWGANKRNARRLLDRLGLPADFVESELPPFPASSMFWFRPCALAPLFDAQLQWSDFEPEPIGDDGSLAHSIERCFCHIAETAGYQSRFVEPLNYEYCWPAPLARKVSVIIPAYNAIDWLPLTLHSILSQSSPAAPFEIVIVDNASTDGTLEFARDFESYYDNVVVVHESTKGAGAARNAGIQSSSGEYITFVDSDDLLTSNALQLLYDAAVLTKVDVVTSSLVVFDEDGYGPLIPFNYERQVIVADKEGHVDQADVWKAIFSDFGPCAKLYRKEWIVGNGINFPEQRNFEDNAFVIDVYLKAKRIAVLSSPTYLYRRYRKRMGLTQSTSLSLDSLQDQIAVFNSLVKKHRLRAEDSLEGVLYECLLKKLQEEVHRFGFGQTTKTGGASLDLGAWLRSLGCQIECGPFLSDLSKKSAA